MREAVRAVLFDLDGTLLDSAPDLIHAANRLRASHGLGPVAPEAFRPQVSQGGRAMLAVAFSHLDPAEREALLPLFLDDYRQNIAVDSRLFDGFAEILNALQAAGLALGIITNKVEWLTTPLLAQLGLDQVFGAVLCGDSLPERKPHPAPVLAACARLGVDPAQAVMVGDDRRDIEAGRAAGCRTLSAAYGYISAGENIHDWGADGVLASPWQLLDWLGIGHVAGSRESRDERR
ncbi:MAG: phosphoglycolate phosphatase [Lysobacterales bacterium]